MLLARLNNRFSATVWRNEERKFLRAEARIRIPTANLAQVDRVRLRTSADFERIPSTGGCYWIWTNEPVIHKLHSNDTPSRFNGGEVIYNGVSQDDVRARVQHHLGIDSEEEPWSGISMDLYHGTQVRSHKKRACSPRGKVPYVPDFHNLGGFVPVRSKDLLLRLRLSSSERKFINDTNRNSYYFRNGIYFNSPKHRQFDFRVYYVTDLRSLYFEFIEKKWRQDFGMPKLCSYSSGR